MGSFKCDHFCGFISPKIGGIILGCVGVIFGILTIWWGLAKWDNSFYVLTGKVEFEYSTITMAGAAILVFSAAYLYGIFSEKVIFLFPGFLLLFAGVFHASGIIIIMILFPLMFGAIHPGILFGIVLIAFLWHLVIFSFRLFDKVVNKQLNDRPSVVYHPTTEPKPDSNQTEVNVDHY